MRKLINAVILAGTLSATVAAPMIADARPHRRYHSYQGRTPAQQRACYDRARDARMQGTAVGAVGGGVLGALVGGRRHRTAGVLLGAGAGAVAGHEYSRSRHHCS